MTRREELLPEIQRLRDVEGLMWREISDRLGIARSTAGTYYADPTGEAARARKAKKDGQCADCGTRTVSDGGVPPERCSRCDAAHVRALSVRWILDSFAEWHRIFGVAPTAGEWNPAACRIRSKHPDDWGARTLARYESTGRPWPCVSLVVKRFGSWNEAVRAAGFEPLTPSEHSLGRRGTELRRSEQVAA